MIIKHIKTKQIKTTLTGITITKKAYEQIHNLIKNSNNIIGIRINIKKSGCAGFRYFLEKINTTKSSEIIFNYKNFIISIPKQDINIIDGTTIDFIQEGINEIFKFYNTKINTFCGCGESFELKS
ncbi:MAG: iron-sulfur cluster assembly accessory protein [Buchnera aphidicola (Eriosoma harunire)]